MESQPAVDARARLPVGKEPETPPAKSAAKYRQCVRNHRPHERKDCAARAKAGGEASLEFGGEPEGYSKITYQRAGSSSAPPTAPREER